MSGRIFLGYVLAVGLVLASIAFYLAQGAQRVQCTNDLAWAAEVDTSFAAAMHMPLDEYYATYGEPRPRSCESWLL